MRIGWQVGLAITARVRPQITFRRGPAITVQTGRRIAGKVHLQTPIRVAPEVTPGTVLRTVPTAVRGASIPACFLQIVTLRCDSTKRYAKSPK
jgi:hypothetical protein